MFKLVINPNKEKATSIPRSRDTSQSTSADASMKASS